MHGIIHSNTFAFAVVHIPNIRMESGHNTNSHNQLVLNFGCEGKPKKRITYHL